MCQILHLFASKHSPAEERRLGTNPTTHRPGYCHSGSCSIRPKKRGRKSSHPSYEQFHEQIEHTVQSARETAPILATPRLISFHNPCLQLKPILPHAGGLYLNLQLLIRAPNHNLSPGLWHNLRYSIPSHILHWRSLFNPLTLCSLAIGSSCS